MTYGERLGKAITLAKSSRKLLALELEISVQAISGICTGTGAFTAENNARAARFLRVDAFWLATSEGEPRPKQELAWPFSVPMSRFTSLTEKQQGIVEGRLIAAIEECERPNPLSLKDQYDKLVTKPERKHTTSRKVV